MTLSRGARLGPYEVTAQIGAGGMGEVYRARDGRLHRDVAIKVLPEVFAQDGQRLARFEREARTLASLNHPNIAALYGLEDAGGVKALVMELVEGLTLADHIARGPIAVADALAIARQISEALEAAHEHGIIHRDLKPANVKVLDFGLAKAMDPIQDVSPGLSTPTLTSPVLTHAGAILGTAAYMSPEQARGYALDKRTDIWAFGCVLYEMLTGRRPFTGDTVSDLVAVILHREPDWSLFPGGLPPNVVTLVQRCLDKNPKRRLRDIGDARIEIDDALSKPAPERKPDSAPAGIDWRRWIAPAGVAAVGLLALVAGLSQRAPVQQAWVNPLANAKFTRFTDFPGTETLASISPDGRFVAFVSDRDGPFHLWWSQVDTGRFVNLTKDLPPLAYNLNVRQMGFSGDGAEVSFMAAGKRVLLPLIGGTPRPFLPPASHQPSWSPDGTQLVYANGIDGDPISIADRSGSNAREIYKDQPGLHNHNVVWSPDGWIYFAHGLDVAEEMDVWRIRPSGGPPERLTHQGAPITFMTPLDPRTLLYVAPAEDRSGPWLWALDVESKASHRVSTGVEQYRSVAASGDGRRVVATVANPSANLWSVPLLGRVAGDTDVEPFSVPTARALGPRFRGTSMFYLSARGTGDGLWRVLDGQATEIWKGSDGALREPPAVSPDGSRAVVMIRKAGKGQLVLVTADGSESKTLADSIDAQGAADWAPDGSAIVTGGSDGQGLGLFRIPIGGGPPVRLVKGMAINPVWSPEGSLIVYAATSVSGRQPLAGVRPDGTPVELPKIQVAPGSQGHRFLPGGKGIVSLETAVGRAATSQFLDIWLHTLDTKTTTHLAHLSGRYATLSFDLTPDGKRIVFDRVNDNSDIVLIDLPR
jgi:Tol biopolymer transport system component